MNSIRTTLKGQEYEINYHFDNVYYTEGGRGFIKKRIYLFYVIIVKNLYIYVYCDTIIRKYM